MNDFLQTVRERGFIHQVTDEAALYARMQQGPLPGYIGFDATADSLHVGSLMQIMLLRWMQKCGHKPVVLMGGGTTRIGDPSFRDDARPLLTDEKIEENKAGIRKVFTPFLTFGDGPTDAVMLDNAAWLDELKYIPFLRDFGRHFSVNRMLTLDSVRIRLEREQSLSFLEFNYMLLQSYDFVELRRRHGVGLQMGGSDQWGNIIMGVELNRRADGAEVFGITTPLLTTASGAKMGKTASGAVWLNAERLSPYDYWQFWRNTEDADVGRFLALFTELPMDEVKRLAALGGAEINEAKKVLATEATALLHGAEAAAQSAETARRAFEEGQAAESLPSIEAPLPAAVIDLAVQAGFAASKGEARRLIRQNGLRLNDEPVADEALAVTPADLRDGAAKLSAGRKRHVLVRQA
ncbi:tyrosine--tRNA ligase [Pseudoroseomonas wenyumeiae]|uniref:Tyrosine--tRNA ligase n=1 Tax=Teichococcus wenyumeiae TaxID=2478470 RepID=A0A3A9J7H5_9PROT|nr:tyrosine--tRNA ligase [Pseudoroseomonas wenyumeiae]RKK03177.1 tyrosine--tRNA ligase [Pseudoroseomonas wenyumeiae]RMI26117.1 tyrosine--tRNA ligase [Pseudoroseomonas wenyumeiae]